MGHREGLVSAAKEIFQESLKRANARSAVLDVVRMENGRLICCNESSLDISRSFYVVAIGKAAYPMAAAIDEVAGAYVKQGVVSGAQLAGQSLSLGRAWKTFFGGHPLPNEESFEAAAECIAMLERADRESAPVLFLISGGGSAMLDQPRDTRVTLSELRELNQVLITSGATISEINSVRRAVSAVKGGGLARVASRSRQISLIISDTRADDVTSVASGPSLMPEPGLPDPLMVIEKYGLEDRMPDSLVRSLKVEMRNGTRTEIHSSFYVLLDNKKLVGQAVEIAEHLGFVTASDDGDHDEMIEEGVAGLLKRATAFRRSVSIGNPVCFVSGGEFGCPVTGSGTGGRNCETVLRAGIHAEGNDDLNSFAFLSAGTDGIDGNSPSAGGVIDGNVISVARSEGVEPELYLKNSDSFTFLKRFDGTIEIGPTGTNVRDLRIMLIN